MTRVLVLGANGRIARWVIQMLAEVSDVELTLYVRDARRLEEKPASADVIEADVLDRGPLAAAMRGIDIVYMNLAGAIDVQTEHVVEAMTNEGVDRLIFINSLGIYDEVPGKFGDWNRQQIGTILRAYRAAAETVEKSTLTYTLLRPAWLTDNDEVSYEITRRDEPFKGTEVSRKSVAHLIVEMIKTPRDWEGANVGVSKPDTDGDKPAFV